MDRKQSKIKILLLIILFTTSIATTPFILAEIFFLIAKKEENQLNIKKAKSYYEMTISLNPFNHKYYLNYADFLIKANAPITKDKPGIKKALFFYEKSIILCPNYSKPYLKKALLLSRINKNSNNKKIKKETINLLLSAWKKEPKSYYITYKCALNLTKYYKFLTKREKNNLIKMYKFLIKVKPYRTKKFIIYIYNKTKDYQFLKKCAGKNYIANKTIFDLTVNVKELNKFASKQYFFLQKIRPHKKESPKKTTNKKYAEGKDFHSEKPINKQGNLYTNGETYCFLNLEKNSTIEIIAKGTPVDKVFPFMVIKIDCVPIASTFVNREWKTYKFKTKSTKGTHKISVEFLNDKMKKKEDRNLFIKKISCFP